MKNTGSHDMPDRFETARKKQTSPATKPKDVVMKPATYDGSVAWTDHKAHSEACAKLNGWTDEQKGLYLLVSLRGQHRACRVTLGLKNMTMMTWLRSWKNVSHPRTRQSSIGYSFVSAARKRRRACPSLAKISNSLPI